jgi:NADH dehydrogenase FAD-containing subunit
MRIVVLGGGFGGLTAVRHLERVLRRHTDVEIALVSCENFFALTPLLFEACSGRLELRHCAQPSALHFNEPASSKPPSNRLTWIDSSFEP